MMARISFPILLAANLADSLFCTGGFTAGVCAVSIHLCGIGQQAVCCFTLVPVMGTVGRPGVGPVVYMDQESVGLDVGAVLRGDDKSPGSAVTSLSRWDWAPIIFRSSFFWLISSLR